MQLKEMWVEKAGLERIDYLLPFKLAPTVEDANRRVLHDSQIAYGV